MQLQKAVRTVLTQLSDSLDQLSRDQYTRSCRSLSGNSIGRHVRHIIEMFQCLDEGYEQGVVDYDKRKRDEQLENHKVIAQRLLQDIVLRLNRMNKPLFLHMYYDELLLDPEIIESNYFREITYNLEHSIHHMALLRIGMLEMGGISLPDGYGVAFSTIKHNRKCAP